MKAYVIYQNDNILSHRAVEKLEKSIEEYDCDIELVLFAATTPKTLERDLKEFPHLEYTYPQQGYQRICEETGMKLMGYNTSDVKKKFACTISHARLWKKCAEELEEIMILEHDAIFTRRYKWPFIWHGGILGLNDPRGATRKSMVFHNKISHKEGIHDCPFVDNENVPQGLAGNSAYIIRPFAAKKLLDKLYKLGVWPNDALMCNQIIDSIKVCYPYFTTVQGGISTTT